MEKLRCFSSALALFAALSLSAAPAPDPTYTALRASRPDGRAVALTNFEFDRDVYHFTLNGTLHLLGRVDGKELGGVFIGDGSYTLTPASPAERKSLSLNTGDDKLTALTDKIERAVFFDSELVKKAASKPGEGSPSPDAIKAYEDFLNNQRKEFKSNLHIRVLQDLLDPSPTPLFLAFVRGHSYGPAVLGVDPRGYDAAFGGSGSLLDGGEKTFLVNLQNTKGGLWYLSFMKSELDGGTANVVSRPAIADKYVVDTTIAPNAEISGSTTISLTPRGTVHVLPFALDGKLRIDDVSYSKADANPPAWTPVAFIQEKPEEDDDSAAIFTTPLDARVPYLVKVTYHGIDKHVLEDAGDGNYTVRARSSWYANIGRFSEPAMFELKFHYPQKNQLIAVGSETENKVEGDQRVSTWKSPRPLRVAGFNYGKFKKLSTPDKESGMTVDVYTNQGEPSIIRDINAALRSGGEGDDLVTEGMAQQVHIDTASLAQAAFADAANTVRVGNLYFGPLADNRIAVTQQSQWFFGQSWPGLIYLPYLAFVNGTVRNTLGFGADMKDFVDVVGPHEMSHQWWGHQVGWSTYHDQWLSEGFAEFSAMLVLQLTGNPKAANNLWEKKRKSIIEKPTGATITSDSAGPITQGVRLSTWRNGSAYSSIVYNKGAYVLHMLQMAMADQTKPNRDEAFIAMMKDFATTYAGKNASTDDFQRVVEKYVPQQMKLTKDGKLDYFFHQWVWGTAVPKYVSNLDVKDIGGGKYQLSGTITQSEVPDDFAVTMPLYLQFDKGLAKIGSIVLVGNQTQPVKAEIPLPQKPQKLLINANHDVLSR